MAECVSLSGVDLIHKGSFQTKQRSSRHCRHFLQRREKRIGLLITERTDITVNLSI